VTAYEDGRFGDLVVHNVADVLRTRELGLLGTVLLKVRFQTEIADPDTS